MKETDIIVAQKALEFLLRDKYAELAFHYYLIDSDEDVYLHDLESTKNSFKSVANSCYNLRQMNQSKEVRFPVMLIQDLEVLLGE